MRKSKESMEGKPKQRRKYKGRSLRKDPDQLNKTGAGYHEPKKKELLDEAVVKDGPDEELCETCGSDNLHYTRYGYICMGCHYKFMTLEARKDKQRLTPDEWQDKYLATD
jgi:hypothetical protein